MARDFETDSAFRENVGDGHRRWATAVRKVTVAKQGLKDYRPENDLFPSCHVPELQEPARDSYAGDLEALKKQYAAPRNASAEAASA